MSWGIIGAAIVGTVLGFVIASVRFNRALDEMGKQWTKLFTEYEEHVYSLLEDMNDDGK